MFNIFKIDAGLEVTVIGTFTLRGRVDLWSGEVFRARLVLKTFVLSVNRPFFTIFSLTSFIIKFYIY